MTDFPVMPRNAAMALIGFLLWLPATASAGSLIHGARAAGMNSAFTAVADDPSAIVHNPAGLVGMDGRHAYLGLTALKPSTEYNDNAGGREETASQVFHPPHLFYAATLAGGEVVAGVGLYSMFGIGGRQWDRSGLTRYHSTQSAIATVSINPTLALRLSESLALGMGLDYMRARNEAERMVDQSVFGAGDGRMNLDLEGDGWGCNLGLLWQATGSVRVGLAWRSGIGVDLDGDLTVRDIAPPLQVLFGGAQYTTAVQSRADFPEIYSLGVALNPVAKWTLAFDVERVRWSSFDVAALDYANEVPAAALTDSVTPLDWEDSWLYKAGVDYVISRDFSVRGGYAYVQTYVPGHTLDPGNPDADQHNYSVGFGYRGARWVLDAFYNLGVFETRRADNAILAGRYDNRVHYLGVSTGYRF